MVSNVSVLLAQFSAMDNVLWFHVDKINNLFLGNVNAEVDTIELEITVSNVLVELNGVLFTINAFLSILAVQVENNGMELNVSVLQVLCKMHKVCVFPSNPVETMKSWIHMEHVFAVKAMLGTPKESVWHPINAPMDISIKMDNVSLFLTLVVKEKNGLDSTVSANLVMKESLPTPANKHVQDFLKETKTESVNAWVDMLEMFKVNVCQLVVNSPIHWLVEFANAPKDTRKIT